MTETEQTIARLRAENEQFKQAFKDQKELRIFNLTKWQESQRELATLKAETDALKRERDEARKERDGAGEAAAKYLLSHELEDDMRRALELGKEERDKLSADVESLRAQLQQAREERDEVKASAEKALSENATSVAIDIRKLQSERDAALAELAEARKQKTENQQWIMDFLRANIPDTDLTRRVLIDIDSTFGCVTYLSSQLSAANEQVQSLQAELVEAKKERDAYAEGCKSAKRGANEWHGKWELNQTEKINLLHQVQSLHKENDRLQHLFQTSGDQP